MTGTATGTLVVKAATDIVLQGLVDLVELDPSSPAAYVVYHLPSGELGNLGHHPC